VDALESPRFRRAILEIDLRNADDPNTISVGDGVYRLKEQTHAEMVTAWVKHLCPDASEPLLLAARAHHLRRWEIPRDTYPTGRVGYLTWRRDLKDLHARELRAILEREGYPEDDIRRAERILRRERLADDPEARTLEDAVCLVFLETQLNDVAGKLTDAKLIDILTKTLRKMSPEGIAASRTISMPDSAGFLLARAEEALGQVQ
jgi:hypothetical protein